MVSSTALETYKELIEKMAGGYATRRPDAGPASFRNTEKQEFCSSKLASFAVCRGLA